LSKSPNEDLLTIIREELRAVVRDEVRVLIAASKSGDHGSHEVHRALERIAADLKTLTETRLVQPGALTVTIEQAQARLGCSRRRVFELLSCGTLKRASRVGRKVMITIDSIDRALLPSPKARRRRTSGHADFELEDIPL